MKSSQLHSLWTAPDNSKLTAKQYSFRLPVHVAAKLAALVEIYPQKSRTEIVGDLLATAIDDLVQGMPYVQGRSMGFYHDQDNGHDEEMFEDIGPAPTFWKIADKYYKELEKELGNDDPPSIHYYQKRKDKDQE